MIAVSLNQDIALSLVGWIVYKMVVSVDGAGGIRYREILDTM